MIEAAAKRLTELGLWERLNNRPSIDSLSDHPDRARCFLDYAGFMSELGSIERELQIAYGRLSNLRNHFAKGEMQPYLLNGKPLDESCEHACKALIEVRQATQHIQQMHPQKTRTQHLQKSATFEAANIVGANDRHVRSIAKRIMLAAKIPEPSAAAITLWINHLRGKC